jgi:hypothetical protein
MSTLLRGKIVRSQFFFSILLVSTILVISSCKKDDPEPPVEISFANDTQTVTEGNQITISIPLERAATEAGTIKIKLSGQAVYTEDYNTDPSGITGDFELEVPAGATSVSFLVATVNNDIYVGDKEIIFTLVDPTSNLAVGSRPTFKLTILEDESQAVANFKVSTGTIQENLTTGVTFEIQFSEAAKGPGTIVVSLASSNSTYGTNFSTLPAPNGNTITLPVGDGATSSSITVVPKDDSFFHENYVIIFEITSTTGSVKKGVTNKLTVTLQEDESPSFASFTITDGVVPEDQTSGVIVPIALSIPAAESGTITVSFSSTSAVYGSHFATSPAASGSNILLNVSKNDVSSQLTIFPIGNSVDNEDRVIFFTISSGTGVVRPGGSINYILTLKDNEPTLRTVLISFGRSTAPLVSGSITWNHLYSDTPDVGTTWTNLKRSDGVVTNLALIVDSYLSPQPNGKTTGINSGAFPDNALKEYWYVPGPNQGITRGFSILYMDNVVQYTFRMLGGTTLVSPDGKNTMTVSVLGESKSLVDVTNNVSEVLTWANKFPAASKATINLTDTDGGGICPINALEISWYED